MAGGIGYNNYKLTYQISPIIFTNGIATFIPGGMLPIISITQSGTFGGGLLSAAASLGLGGLVGSYLDLDDFFAHFHPLPGSTLVDNRVATFPFANQAIAANAIIAQPLVVSMMMIVPARGDAGAAIKTAVMSALQSALVQHSALGGTFIVATPSYYYTNCIHLKLTDVSAGETKQSQYRYQWDFYQPLLTEQQAAQSMNASMSKINGQLPTDGSLSGNTAPVNVPPSLVGISTTPAGANLGGSAAAPPGPVSSPPLP